MKQDDEGGTMYAVVRNYAGSGASELFDALGQRHDEIRELFVNDVPGFISYAAVQTGPDSGTTVTVCQDQAGAEESSRVAAAWVAANLAASGAAPTVSAGTAVACFTAR
jgi:hypothetical protein